MAPLFALAVIVLLSRGQEPVENGQHELSIGPPPVPKPIEKSLGGNDYLVVTFSQTRIDDKALDYYCTRPCKGKKHLSHDQCDLSCDDRCPDKHVKWAWMDRPFFHGEQKDEDGFDKGLQKFGITGKSTRAIADALNYNITGDIIDYIDKKIGNPPSKTIQHWNTTPCSWVERDYYAAQFVLTAHLQLVRRTPGENGAVIETKGPKVDLTGKWEIETGAFKDLPPVIDCRCAIVEEAPKKADPPKESTGGEHGSIIIDDGKFQHCSTATEVEQFKLTCDVEDMSHCTWSAENPTDHDVDCTIQPGVNLICTSDSEQDLCTTSTVRLHLPAHTVRGPSAVDRISEKGRVACINLLKRMPDGSTKYRIGGTCPPTVVALARFEDRGGFKDSESQMRIWIVTDHAGRDLLEKHVLLPRPTPERYARALQVVSGMPNFDLSDPAYLACLDPELLAADVSRDTTHWLVQALIRYKPGELAKSIAKPVFTALWNSPNADAHAADVANELCAADRSDLAAKFLMEVVPAADRSGVAAKGGVEGISATLSGSDPKSARRALDVLDKFGGGELGLLNVSGSMPGDVKSKAAELLKRLQR